MHLYQMSMFVFCFLKKNNLIFIVFFASRVTGAKPVTGLFDGDLGSDVAGYVSETLWRATFDLGAIYFVESFRLFGDRDNDKRVLFFYCMWN